MMAVVLRGLAARKLRSLLTMVAIVLGVAMISGSLILTDTFQRATEELFQGVYGEADAVVLRERAFETGGEESRPFPAEVLSQVRELPEVQTAAGEVQNLIHLVGEDGQVLNTGPAPTFGWAFDMTQPFYPLDLDAGAWPTGDSQAAIDLNTAEKLSLELGSTVRIVAGGTVHSYQVSGIARYGGADPSLTPSMAVLTIPEAQRAFGREGMFDSIKVAAVEGVSPEELVERLESVLPAGLQVDTGAEQAVADSADIAQITSILRAVLLALAGVALVVGALVIFNTMSITVAQRVRELAVLRTLGASRRQVLFSVMLEALVVGLAASLLGLFTGLALAEGLRVAFSSFGMALPPIDRELGPITIAASLLSGVLVAVAAGLIPALKATRVPPIAAVREAPLPPGRLNKIATPAGLAASAFAAALLAGGVLFADLGLYQRLGLMVGGGLLLFLATVLLIHRLVPPLTRIVGAPGAWLGRVPGRLARDNAGRQPGRTAATAGALLVGLALISFVAVLGQGLGTSISDAVKDQLKADYVLAPAGSFAPASPAAAETLASLDQVRVASVRGTAVEVQGSRATLTGVDFATIDQAYRFDWAAGSLEDLQAAGSRGAAVEQGFANENGLGLGSRISVVGEFGEQLDLEITALYESSQLQPMLGQVVIPLATFDGSFGDPRDLYAFVSTSVGASPQATSRLQEALAAFPGVQLHTTTAYAAERQDQIEPVLTMLYALLAFSVVVSFFGIVNTLVLAVHERTRELGLLRAVGMTRWQVRGMIGLESLITAVLGSLGGIALGVLLGALVTAALSDAGLSVSLPLASLLVFALAGSLVGIVAAVFPARRAARLDILQALQYE